MAVPDWVRNSMVKSGVVNTGSKTKTHIKDMGSPFHGKKQNFADGGEVEQLKQEGLAASNKDAPVSFWQRIKDGNIDDPNSMAYTKYGAGRGAEERLQKREDARDAAMNDIANAAAKKNADREAEYDKAEKEMDKLDKMKAEQKAKPKPAVKAAAPKPKAPDYARPDPHENESPAETARLKRQSQEAGERQEASQPFFGKPRRKTPPGGVEPRPMLNWSTPADRARWDEKYKATHNSDGTPK